MDNDRLDGEPVLDHPWAVAFLLASLEESVGEVGFRERAEIVIERGLVGFLGTKSVGFSGDQF